MRQYTECGIKEHIQKHLAKVLNYFYSYLPQIFVPILINHLPTQKSKILIILYYFMWYMCKDFHLKDNLNTHMIMMYYITENNWNIFRIIKYSVKNVEQKYIPAINRNIMLDVIQPGLSFLWWFPRPMSHISLPLVVCLFYCIQNQLDFCLLFMKFLIYIIPE